MPDTRIPFTGQRKGSMASPVSDTVYQLSAELSTEAQLDFRIGTLDTYGSQMPGIINSTVAFDLESMVAVSAHDTASITASSDNSSLSVPSQGTQLEPLASQLVTNSLVVTFGCISICITVINILLLVSSKFTNGGRTPVLIFVRSLCVADALTGIFGMSKMSQVLTQWQWINCFLPESILFSATIAFNLTQVMLSTMCYSMLKDLLRFDQRQDKHRSIFSMTFLWNGSFIIGFVPHMGWNVDVRMGWNSASHICLFLKYFSWVYLVVVTAIVGICLLWLILVNIALQVLISYHRIRDPSQLMLVWPVIRATRVDVALQLICYMPGALYIFLPCLSCAYQAEPLVANANLWLFMPLMVFRAMCSTALHATRTPQLRDVIAYSAKLCQHQMMLMLGMSVNTERPVLSGTSIFVIQTGEKSSSVPNRNVPQRYSWRQDIKGRVRPRGHQLLRTQASAPGSLGIAPILEEPSTLSVDTGIVHAETDLSIGTSATTSQSTSNMTLMSSLGSSLQSSSTATNGTVSPTSSTSSKRASTKKREASSMYNSHSDLLHLQQKQERFHTAASIESNPYWAGSLPQRTSQSILPYILGDEPEQTSSQQVDPSVPLVPQRHLLWARSPLASRMTSTLYGLPHSPRRSRKKEALNNNTNPGSPGSRDGTFRTNILQSEVVVHVPTGS